MKLSLGVALLACLAVCVLADDAADHQKCTPLQKVKVKRQWDKAFGEGKHRLEFGHAFYKNVFKTFPKARELFAKFRGDNIYSPEFTAYSQRFLNAFAMIIETTDDPEANKVIIAKAKTNFAEKGVKPEFFDAFRDELMETLPDFLDHFDWDAWMGCLNGLIAGLK